MSRTILRTQSMATQARTALETLATREETATELVTLDALAALGDSYRSRTSRRADSASRRFVTALVLTSVALSSVAGADAAPRQGVASLLVRG